VARVELGTGQTAYHQGDDDDRDQEKRLRSAQTAPLLDFGLLTVRSRWRRWWWAAGRRRWPPDLFGRREIGR
jgi:hypothetical protein